MHTAPRRPAAHLLTALILAGITLAAGATGAQDDVRLPDLGSSANALISPQEAQDYGASMLRQMRSMDMVVDDPLLDDYINSLGYRLVASCEKPKDHFAFFIVKDPEINAFAAPGGYIAVNSGLIIITQSESELAAVMAHEIGHITQNHLQRAFEDSKHDTPLLALILLGAIAAGSSGRANGDSGAAVLAGGQGLLAQKQINFTRKDETEADRVGIQTLSKAGFDPNAMAGFFQRMDDVLSAGAGGINVPELLQDHPVTSARISDAKARANTIVAQQKLLPTGSTLDKTQWAAQTAPIAYVKDPTALLAKSADQGDLIIYQLMRERVRVLSGDPYRLTTYYTTALTQQHDFNTPANHYGYALALTLSGNGSKAIGQLQPLLTAHPDNLILRLAMADAKSQAGHRAEALAIYDSLNASSPRNRAVALAYAKALTVGGSVAQATQAADMLRPLLDNADEPDIYTAYAHASEKAGDAIRAGEAYADASYLSGRPFDSLEQLKRLLKRTDLDYYARVRIQARIADLTPLVMELHKRRVKTDDNPNGQNQQLGANQACSGKLCFSLDNGRP